MATVATPSTIWASFAEQEKLSDKQLEQCKKYVDLLLAWNERSSLTTITDLENILAYHFKDSWQVGSFIDVNTLHCIADVGSGAGFPGLPLKIKYPHLNVILIEVTLKKLQFLDMVIKSLALDNVDCVSLDWRTFLRTTNYAIDLFCSRAALPSPEFMRMFKPGCKYNKARLVYWASKDWMPVPEEESYLRADHPYKVGLRNRRYILFSRTQS